MGPNRSADDLPELLKRYIRQETLDPLRSLGRFVGYGLAGACFLIGGCLLIAVGSLRLLQSFEPLTGFRSWVPYLVISASMVGLALLAYSRIGRGSVGETKGRVSK